MYSKLPNLIIGFHGCDKSVHDRILYENKSMTFNNNDYDWLGNGIYFWENNLKRAEKWAEDSEKITQPAVIGAVIDLGHCLNLVDSESIEMVKNAYDQYIADMKVTGQKIPENTGKTEDKALRKLDCAVIEYLHSNIKSLYESNPNSSIPPFDSVRGVFIEGKPIYPGAGFREKTHIQLCIRNPNCIKGYFEPRSKSSAYPIP